MRVVKDFGTVFRPTSDNKQQILSQQSVRQVSLDAPDSSQWSASEIWTIRELWSPLQSSSSLANQTEVTKNDFTTSECVSGIDVPLSLRRLHPRSTTWPTVLAPGNLRTLRTANETGRLRDQIRDHGVQGIYPDSTTRLSRCLDRCSRDARGRWHLPCFWPNSDARVRKQSAAARQPVVRRL